MRQTTPTWRELLPYCTPSELKTLAAIAAQEAHTWRPLRGPQTMAYESMADVVGYGGAAGGGKTDLGIGKSLTKHQKILVLRREATQLTGIIDRYQEVLGSRDGFNGQERIWRLPNRQIEFGSTPNPGDWTKYQGRPHDLLWFDEAANFLESQVRALLAWLRTTDPKQHCQALLSFNPPTNAEGQWIVTFFAPWLDEKYPVPAEPGEIRYFAMIDGTEIEVPTKQPFRHGGELITPQSRTFIPARVTDNPYLTGTGYMSTLQALPEPLRSQMLKGDFKAGMQDDVMQVIPTAWVDAAMERWKDLDVKPEMSSLGVDVARGGQDNTVISRRHDNWYDKLLSYPGAQTPNGPSAAALVIAASRDSAPQHVDVIGVGASVYDFLNTASQHVLGINVSEEANATDKSGRLGFFNLRSQLWWQMREDLDPSNNKGIALPPDSRLKADLCAPKWELLGKRIKVESRDDIVKRIGRSPDYASAVILARMDTPKLAFFRGVHENKSNPYNPFENLR